MTANPIGALVALPWLFVLLACLLGFAAFAGALAPALVERAGRNVDLHPVRCELVGLVNVLFFGVVAAALLGSHTPGGRFLGAAVGTLLLGLALLGSVGLARLAGDRLRPSDGPTRRLLAGAVSLWLAVLVPVVGWYLVSTLVVLVGCGAAILALIGWRGSDDARQPND